MRKNLTYRQLLRELSDLWARDAKMLKEPDLLDILDDLATVGVDGVSDLYFRELKPPP